MEATRNYPWEQRIKRKIRKYLPEDEVEFTIINNNNLDVYIKTKSARLTILCGETFTKCKEYIDKTLSYAGKTSDLCNICLDNDFRFTGCAICKNRWCFDCMFEMMRRGQGIAVCPYCKHEVGYKRTPMEVEMMIAIMKQRIMSMVRSVK